MSGEPVDLDPHTLERIERDAGGHRQTHASLIDGFKNRRRAYPPSFVAEP